MADTNRNDPRGGNRQQGPARQEQIDQQEALRNDLSRAASHQAKPETERPEAMRAEESGTAKASAQAAGDANPEKENLRSQDASVGAFEASRGGWESKKPGKREE